MAIGLGGLLVAPAMATAAPRIVSATFAERPVAGQAATLVVRVRDPLAAVNGLRVDFGDGSRLWESACRPVSGAFSRRGPFAAGRAVELRVSHLYAPASAGERMVVSVAAHAGDCAGGLEVARDELRVRVRALPVPGREARPRARPAQLLACGDVYSAEVGALGKRLRCLTNVVRTARGLSPLRGRRRLGRAASAHAADMLRRDFFAHVSPDGADLLDRLRGARVRVRGSFAENLAAGTGVYATPAGLLLTWLESPPHAANLLAPRFNRAGLGIVPGMPGEPGADGAVAVLVLAGR